jgi:hypothetical protein
VSHLGHEFLQVRARVGRELVPGVPQVVKVHALRWLVQDRGASGLRLLEMGIQSGTITETRFRSFPRNDHFGIAGPVPENALGRSRPQQPSHLGGECFDTVTE